MKAYYGYLRSLSFLSSLFYDYHARAVLQELERVLLINRVVVVFSCRLQARRQETETSGMSWVKHIADDAGFEVLD